MPRNIEAFGSSHVYFSPRDSASPVQTLDSKNPEAQEESPEERARKAYEARLAEVESPLLILFEGDPKSERLVRETKVLFLTTLDPAIERKLGAIEAAKRKRTEWGAFLAVEGREEQVTAKNDLLEGESIWDRVRKEVQAKYGTLPTEPRKRNRTNLYS
jgi:hypothetical protein